MNNATFTSYHELAKKNDNRRVWLEGEPLLRAGFNPGDFYSVNLNVDTLVIGLTHIPDSKEARLRHKNREIRKVSRRKMTGWIKPIIDICNAEITSLFGEFARFRAQAFKGSIEFGIHPEDLARARRENSILENMKNGFVTKGDAFLGFGISSHAVSKGADLCGLKTKQLWAVEMEARYIDIAVQNSPEVYKDAHLFCGKVEEVEKTLLEPVNSFSFSMACTNYSSHGITKKNLSSPEMGDEVTSLFGVVDIIKYSNPAVLFSENVPNAKGSVSYELLKKELNRLGYVTHDMILTNKESGAIEGRRRYWMVAFSKGLNLDVETLIPRDAVREYETFGEIKEDVTDEKAWHPSSKLFKREAINKANGRNFSVSRADDDSIKIGTIPRNYSKHQVSNPHVFSKDGSMYRLLTKTEHAKSKLVPTHLVDNCSASVAHEGLGQGIAYYHAVGLAQSTYSKILSSIA